MSKLERLLKLLAVLLDTQIPISAEDLRRRIGGYPESAASFRRTFERDKDDLRTMGVTISVESVPATEPPLDGYIVHKADYAGQDPGLEADELAALHLAAALVRVENLGEDPFWKLGGSGDSQTTAGVAGTVPAADAAGQFHTAISERRVAKFLYRDVERSLEPSRISFVQGNWYVSGHDQTRDAARVFRVDRIEGAITLGEPDAYEPRPTRGPEITRTWELGDEEPVDAVVRIDATAALWANVHLRSDEIEAHSDGSVSVHVKVRNRERFRDWVLSFVDAAEIESPEELRAEMLQWLDAVTEAHA